MTFRAVVIGLYGALFIAAFGYVAEQVFALQSLINGHLVPIIVFGPLVVAMAAVNPLLYRLRPSWAFKPAEMAVSLAMTLSVCSIPARGLLEHWGPAIVMPIHYNTLNPGWKTNRLLGQVPPSMLPAGGQYDSEVVADYMIGRGRTGAPIRLTDVPWAKWQGPLLTWMPLVGLMAVSVICLSLIVHRQWVSRERLRYPIAEFAASLMAQEPGRAAGPIFRNRRFWIGLTVVFLIRAMNGYHQWHPEKSLEFPLTYGFSGLTSIFPNLGSTPWGQGLLFPMLFPMVVGFAYFLASDVSLSMGLSQLICVPVAAYLIAEGVDVSSDVMAGGVGGWQRFGSFLAFAFILLYIGRRYYWHVLKQAVSFRPQEGVERYAGWACRMLIVSLTAMIVIAVSLGLPWPLAILTFGLMMLTFLGVSRISAETGLFFIQPRWQALGVLLGLFGAFALSPQAIIIIGLLCAVLTMDVSQSLMPYTVHALKICDGQRLKPARIGCTMGVTWALGLLVALPIALWANYNYGLRPQGWSTDRVPKFTFRAAEEASTRLSYSGQLEESLALGPLERLREIRPSRRFLWSAGVGFGLVILFGVLRLRFPWWPLHPVMFLVWDTHPLYLFSHSFLLGWLIKTAVSRFGGAGAYQRLKPLMIGVVAGDLLGGMLFMAVGGIYFGQTGLIPVSYDLYPK